MSSSTQQEGDGERFDVVIVGSGPVGSGVARELRDRAPKARVLLVEAGPAISEPRGRHVKTIVDDVQRKIAQVASQGPYQVEYEPLIGPPVSSGGRVPERPGLYVLGDRAIGADGTGMPAAAMSTNVGGMGAHWSCACPTPGGTEVIEFLPADEVAEEFDRARELLSVTADAFVGAPLSKEVQTALGGIYDNGRAQERQVQPMPLAIQVDHERRYWVGTDVILQEQSASAEFFELRTETVALRVVVDDDGRATGVLLRDRRDGTETIVQAQAVVVAGDALRSPQLLFASGIRPAALGRYLNDQPEVIDIVQLADELIPQDAQAAPAKPSGQVEQFSGVTWIPFDDDTFAMHGQIVQMDAGPVAIDTGKVWPGSIVGIGLFACKDIQSQDRVEFSEQETDWLGLPKMTIHYTLTDRDRANIAAMFEQADRIASALGRRLGDGPIELAAGSSLHYQGSVRMGAVDDGTSVCDTVGRVWGTKNVYVAGNGVIPTPTACNPTLTSVALGVRTARAIADDLTSAQTAAVGSTKADS